jgi:carbohydrate kinase (thermoresistant glucokinase family)
MRDNIPMPKINGLRSPYAQTGRLVYFGRMLDKIRLEAQGQLPLEYKNNLGSGTAGFFDARCCRFLGIEYEKIKEQVLAGKNDEELSALILEAGIARSDEDCVQWNHFMMKRGWRDDGQKNLQRRIEESPQVKMREIQTMFDYIDYDEGRDPVASKSWELRVPVVVLLMGVAGVGKSTVGLALAEALGWDFRDADSFHPQKNIAKMSAGQPLDDLDRAPWLAAIATHIKTILGRGENGVVTCSALKESYRKAILANNKNVILIHLHGEPEIIRERIEARENHFMKPAMLESQLAALEHPQDALRLDVVDSTQALVTKIRAHLNL